MSNYSFTYIIAYRHNIERLQIELKKAEENLEQQTFFVTWLKGAIAVEEIKQLTKEL